VTGFFTAPQIAWGPGAIEQLSGLGAQRALLLVDPVLTGTLPVRRLEEEFQKSDTALETSSAVTIEPTVASIAPFTEAIRRYRPDWIVAIGGGSTLDTAKAAWAHAARPELDPTGFSPLVEYRARSVARFVAVPTTTGSGSEVSGTAHLRRDGDRRRLELGGRELTPDWAIVDPSFVAALPLARAAESAADLIAHAFEALVSEWSSPFTDAVALRALGIAIPGLTELARHPAESDVRAPLQIAATLAGLAAANAQVGVAHALADALGGPFPIGHARLVAAVLPTVVEFDFPSARDKLAPLAPIVGGPAIQSRSGLPEKLRALWAGVHLPLSLVEAGIDRERLADERPGLIEAARSSPALVANPRVPSADELGKLLDAAADRTPVQF